MHRIPAALLPVLLLVAAEALPAAPLELSAFAGGGISNMGVERGIPLTFRAHTFVESGTSYGVEGGYTDWGEREEAECAGPGCLPAGVRETSTFVFVSGKWRGRGDAGRSYFGFGGGVHRRDVTAPGFRERRFGGGFSLVLGYERVAPVAPVAELALRVAGADRDLLTMLMLSVGLNWNQ